MVHRRGTQPSVCYVRTEINPTIPCVGNLTWHFEGFSWTFSQCRIQQTYKDHKWDRVFHGWAHKILDRRWRWPYFLFSIRANVYDNGAIRNQQSAKTILGNIFAFMGESVDLTDMPDVFYPELVYENAPATEVIDRILQETLTTIVGTLSDGFRVLRLGTGVLPPPDDALHPIEPFCAESAPQSITVQMRPTVFQFPLFLEPVVARPATPAIPEVQEIVRLRQHAPGQFQGITQGYRNLTPFIPWLGLETSSVASIANEMEMSPGGSFNDAFTLFRLAINHDWFQFSPEVYGVNIHGGKGISAPTYPVNVSSIAQVNLLPRLLDGTEPYLFGRYYGSTQFVDLGMSDALLSPFRAGAYRNFEMIPELYAVKTADPVFLPTDRVAYSAGAPNEGTGWATEPILWLYAAYNIRDEQGQPVRLQYSRTLGGGGAHRVFPGYLSHSLVYINEGTVRDNRSQVEAYANDLLDAIQGSFTSSAAYDISYAGIQPFETSGLITRLDWVADSVQAPRSRVLIQVEDDLWD
jgi:hypothetical protein